MSDPLASVLRQRRTGAGLPLGEAARRAGITSERLAQLEASGVTATFMEVVLLAAAYGTGPDEIAHSIRPPPDHGESET
jgi:transcriptional regulator with XRE-family HTH domain